jgi:hypothetical protein
VDVAIPRVQGLRDGSHATSMPLGTGPVARFSGTARRILGRLDI